MKCPSLINTDAVFFVSTYCTTLFNFSEFFFLSFFQLFELNFVFYLVLNSLFLKLEDDPRFFFFFKWGTRFLSCKSWKQLTSIVLEFMWWRLIWLTPSAEKKAAGWPLNMHWWSLFCFLLQTCWQMKVPKMLCGEKYCDPHSAVFSAVKSPEDLPKWSTATLCSCS